MTPREAYNLLETSTVAIAKIDKTQLPGDKTKIDYRTLGTGFIISPKHLLTAGHLFDDSLKNNPAKIGIIKRTISGGRSLKNTEIRFICATGIVIDRELDVALLEFDFEKENDKDKINLYPIKPLPLNFDKDRSIGDSVYWLGMAINDATAMPRFFMGGIVSHYINDSKYKLTQSDGSVTEYTAPDLNIIEINHQFLPGCSGSPILSTDKNAVIGFVHGYSAWPLGVTNDKLTLAEVVAKQGQNKEIFDLEVNAPVVGSLSRGIDLINIQDFLNKNNAYSALTKV